MGQIWITGDTHGDVTRLGVNSFPEQREMTKEDVVIILGDFGLLWEYTGETSFEKYWLDWLDKKPFTTLFIDGNHECFPRLFALPEEERYGAPVGVVRPSVLYLKRGYIYHVNEKSIFAFGGARSHDISDGIINLDGNDTHWKDTMYQWRREKKEFFRVNGVSWWKDEIEQDPLVYQRGLDLLEESGNQVDLIITHCCASMTEVMMGMYQHDQLTDYLQKIHDTVDFNDWCFGHYHRNQTVSPHEYCIYEQIVELNCNEGGKGT